MITRGAWWAWASLGSGSPAVGEGLAPGEPLPFDVHGFCGVYCKFIHTPRAGLLITADGFDPELSSEAGAAVLLRRVLCALKVAGRSTPRLKVTHGNTQSTQRPGI